MKYLPPPTMARRCVAIDAASPAVMSACSCVIDVISIGDLLTIGDPDVSCLVVSATRSARETAEIHFFFLLSCSFVYADFRCHVTYNLYIFGQRRHSFFFTLFPPPFKISNHVKIAQWCEPCYTETLSCQLSNEGDESEDKKVRGWPCELGQRERFKVPVFLSYTRRVVGD